MYSHKNQQKSQKRLKATHPDAKVYALKLLSYRSRSKKEVIQKLKEKGFDTQEIDRVVDFLEGAGFIKDAALAESLLRNAVERKYLGRKGIKMLFARRGIEKELTDETLSTLTEDIERESAMRLAEKKLKTLRNFPSGNADIIKQKLWMMLVRRGFSGHVINSVIKSLEKKES
ncbi:MAG: regulatory protein RecX [Nitrospirae bacterium]|nr:regulatory protein RecX [Nitrospirota bacterium]